MCMTMVYFVPDFFPVSNIDQEHTQAHVHAAGLEFTH